MTTPSTEVFRHGKCILLAMEAKKMDFMKMKMKLTLAVSLIASSFAFSAHAGIVTNDTDLLTGTGHAQLAEWLGEDVDLTRIFAKGVGDNSYDWHAAVDYQGRTFTVMEIFDNTTNQRRVIGGYNDESWTSMNSWGSSANAFLFNLSSGSLYEKNARYTNGALATYNYAKYGATFGGGHDLQVNAQLTAGYAYIGHTYGDMSRAGESSYQEEFTGGFNDWKIGAYETFTLSASTGRFGFGANALLTESGEIYEAPSDVPVPFALAGLSLLGLGFARRK